MSMFFLCVFWFCTRCFDFKKLPPPSLASLSQSSVFPPAIRPHHPLAAATPSLARAAADRLLSRLDPSTGEAIRNLSLDSQSAGVRRQAELREAAAGDGFIEDNLWTGIGQARSGCGAAIVGDPDQVLAKLRAYQAMGIEAFILSGYPHQAEADLFARHVLPHLAHGPLQPG